MFYHRLSGYERGALASEGVYLKIDGRMAYLWRAVDAEGEVLDVLVQSSRDKPPLDAQTDADSSRA